MIIERKQEPVEAATRMHAFWRFLSITVVVLLVLLGISIFLIYKFPVFSNYQATKYFEINYKNSKVRYDEAGEENLLPLFRKAALESLVSNTSRYLGSQSMPSININVDFESWESIKAERAAMLGRRMATGNRDYYKASIQYNGKSIPVKIRLKGERTDHIKRPKRWSFRVKTRKGKSLFGKIGRASCRERV